MNRRSFLATIAAGLAAEAIPGKRVYSFLWGNPLVSEFMTVGWLAAERGRRILVTGLQSDSSGRRRIVRLPDVPVTHPGGPIIIESVINGVPKVRQFPVGIYRAVIW